MIFQPEVINEGLPYLVERMEAAGRKMANRVLSVFARCTAEAIAERERNRQLAKLVTTEEQLTMAKDVQLLRATADEDIFAETVAVWADAFLIEDLPIDLRERSL